ncbi:DUF6214 family protein [Streptomyces sp. NBC_00690]|uniref:DUF6214 family protein n=1 Tax=Streptomyces sp. NBC_00690 TaxID=2975808 RepID=UPI002E2D56E2|nr:DUF6214 family protein [Streptomyces sp. NBC_00690]
MLPYPPVWEVQSHGTATTTSADPSGDVRRASSSWIDVRLTFADGVRLDVMAVADRGNWAVEEMHAHPPLPLESLAVLGDRIGTPVTEACRAIVDGSDVEECDTSRSTAEDHRRGPAPSGEGATALPQSPGDRIDGGSAVPGHRRVRPARLRGRAARRRAADAYLAAQQQGLDPVLAVMSATGRSRRKSLRVIAGARDEGLLPSRHNRRRGW